MTAGSKIVISKWHLDCISPTGDFFVGSATSLRWSKLHVNLVTGIFGRNDRIERKNTVAFQEVFPRQLNNEELMWDCAPLGVKGNWRVETAPIEKKLHAGPNEQVTWYCVAPRAEATVQVGNEYTLQGTGYAELIQITADEWTLPMHELRWGRYLSEKEMFVWIDMTGVLTHAWVWRNGEEQGDASVTDDIVAIDNNITLGLAYRKAIREGHLSDTLLSSLPVLGHLAPRKMADIYECTWRTRGVLLKDTEEVDTGWAIHQLIRFPN